MIQLTEQEFFNKVVEKKGAIILSFDTCTQVKLKKSFDKAYKEEHGEDTTVPTIFKTSSINGVINYNYENSVNRALVKDGKPADFEVQERAWGTRIFDENNKPTPFVSHNGNLYVSIKPEKASNIRYVDSNGNTWEKADLEPYFYARKKPEHGVEVRDFNMKHINIVRAWKQTFCIVHN